LWRPKLGFHHLAVTIGYVNAYGADPLVRG